ncbi:hypothetical protein HU200_038456 [Digitaria exilis]|uniref:Uncharacterized protein n=1 Tax=Digitaria exilis TaxID=1010633 RepID=A0A835BD02_9POAL|nr:hypothetical protein HU200_038456 [Digitaria exilis]
MGGVVVTKSSPVIVRPPEPAATTTVTIRLSSFDVGLHTIPANVLLMFEHPIHEPAETIKRALSQALVPYYPIAGRIVAGASDGEVNIQCTGEGVAFVSASVGCALKEAISLDRSPGARATLLDELAVYYPGMRCGPGDPLMLMQVTEFSCGGFTVGVTGNHGVGDGAGWAQFLQAVGELASGSSSPSTVPIRQDDSLPSRPSSVGSLSQLMTSLEPFDDLACVDITVPSRVISSIKAEYAKRFDGQTCTSFEAVSAVLWQCRTRAIMSDPETPALFLFGVNLREYMGAKKGYYGNCATGQLVMAKSGAVANGDIMDLVTMIKESKEKIPDQFKKNEGTTPQKPVDQRRLMDQQVRYNMLTTSSWRNLGFEKVDFGSGRPARVTPYAQDKLPFPACMMSLPHKGKDGANIFTAMVKEEHVDSFLKELTRFT